MKYTKGMPPELDSEVLRGDGRVIRMDSPRITGQNVLIRYRAVKPAWLRSARSDSNYTACILLTGGFKRVCTRHAPDDQCHHCGTVVGTTRGHATPIDAIKAAAKLAARRGYAVVEDRVGKRAKETP